MNSVAYNNQNLPVELISERLRQALPDGRQSFEDLQMKNGGGRCAAVLVLFVQAEDGWRLLFIRRTDTVPDHKGQVAFPGGGCERSDGDLEATALRETEEEIGIRPGDVCILGRLPSLHTNTDFLVTPVVGTVRWPYNLILSPEEVGRAFTIPLAYLADPRNREERPYISHGREFMVTFFRPYDGEILWGASAWMVLALLKSLNLE